MPALILFQGAPARLISVHAAKMAELHIGIWWGAFLPLVGTVYVYFFRLGRQR